ncbi:SSRP1 [Symbiodinium natans]|uniref:SSRP1 protein n=1 Tax=Symbiodinium natans TaxID=878477 RepID=A0A812P8Z7_9DINO|nr:SSRP1 [Symbiodinium natans]
MASEQPKKPTGGAYGSWLAEHRAELQKEVGPGKPACEVAKLAGVRFKALSEDTKAIYQKKFEEAKAKYDADMAAFLEAGGEKKSIKRKAEKSAKRKKDPAAPKKPAGGAFGCFLAKNRATFTEECKGQPVTAITKMASDRWKKLSEEEKKVYQEDYEAKRAEYEEAMKSYVPLPSTDNDAEKPVARSLLQYAKKARLSPEQKEAAKQSKDAEKAQAKEKKAADKQAKADAKASKAKAAPKKAGGKGLSMKAAPEAPSVELPPTVAAKAEKAGLKDQLMKLAVRPDMVNSFSAGARPLSPCLALLALSLTSSSAAMACEQPKKPTGGAYGSWLAEHRAELQKEVGPGKPACEVAKLAGVRFKALSEDTKAIYQKKFEEAKAKYDADMAAFLEAGGEKKSIKRKAEKSAKRKKDPAAPKKPAGGAFGCFLAKNRATFTEECKGQPVTAITKLASDRWKKLSEEDKKVYQEDYEAKKAEYEEAMKSYVPLPSTDNDAEKPAAGWLLQYALFGDCPVLAKKARMSPEQKEAAKQSKDAEKAQAKDKKAADKQAKADAKASKAKAAPKKAGGKGLSMKAAPEAPSVELPPTVAAKAEKAGLKDQLMKLAVRPDMVNSGKSHGAMLKALEESGGLIHPAKRALLGA